MPPTPANDRTLIEAMGADPAVRSLRSALLREMVRYRYSYNYTWFDRPIIQLPEDIVAIQEVILDVKPDLVIETGIAHGGSLVLSASLLELLGEGEAVGIDLEIRPANRAALERHPLRRRFSLIEGSSTSAAVLDQVRAIASRRRRPLVILDSDHTHSHVERELELYSPFVCKGSYMIVLDTIIEEMPAESYPDRSWGPGNSPMSALRQFLQRNDRFEIDRELCARLLFSCAPNGYLRCVNDPPVA